MKIEKEHIQAALSAYTINDKITNLHTFIEAYDESDENIEVKVITKVDFGERKPLVLKFLHEKQHPHDIIEVQSAFSELLRENGIITVLPQKH